MKKLVALLVMLLLIFSAVACTDDTVSSADDSSYKVNLKKMGKGSGDLESSYIKALDNFGAELFSRVYDKGENMNISPLGLHMSLSLLSHGTDGNTQDEILKTLGVSSYTEGLLKKQNMLIFEKLYKDTEESKLLLANSMWMDENSKFQDEFITSALESYYSELYRVNFSLDETYEDIDKWAREKTNDLVGMKVDKDEETVLVIMNAIYLSDEWNLPFDKEKTKEGTFTLDDGTEVSSMFMNEHFDHVSYHTEDDFFKIRLELKEVGYVELILPSEEISIDDFVQDNELITRALNISCDTNGEATIRVPKLEIEVEYILNDVLRGLGIVDAFEENADFSRLTEESTGLRLSNVKQNTYFAFDEIKVEAAAVTMEQVTMESVQIVVIEDFNRPFVYSVRSNDGALLFAGAVNNPNK